MTLAGQQALQLPTGARELPSSSTEATIEVRDPATGDPVAHVPDYDPAEGVEAVGAGARAMSAWQQKSAEQRASTLTRIAQLLRTRREELAQLVVLESGKPLAEADGEVLTAADFFDWYAGEALRHVDQLLPQIRGKQPLVLSQARGVVFAITPWNDPLGIPVRKIAPALAAGCAIVLKPAAKTPLAVMALADICREAGLPPDLLRVVPTTRSRQLADLIFNTPRVRKFSFTGSTAVGRELSAAAAAHGIPATLELGGNAAFIVRRDAALEHTSEAAVQRKFRNAGQGCTCVNRMFVHRDREEAVLEHVVAHVQRLRLGHGLWPTTRLGPVISKQDVSRLRQLVDEAVASGARIVHEGSLPQEEEGVSPVNFFPPVVLAGVDDGMRVSREEIFGPILPILTFDDDEEAVTRANATEYGLAAYVFSGDVDTALELARKLEAGLVGINDAHPQGFYYPVGGTKASGYGVEGGREGFSEFLVPKAVSITV